MIDELAMRHRVAQRHASATCCQCSPGASLSYGSFHQMCASEIMSRWLQGSKGPLGLHVSCTSWQQSERMCATRRDVRSRLTRMEKMLDMMQLGEFKLQEVTRKVRWHSCNSVSLHSGMPSCCIGHQAEGPTPTDV